MKSWIELSTELAIAHAKQGECILTEMLIRHYGSKCWNSEQEVLEMLERDGLILFRAVHPFPKDPEFILMRGPETPLGEKLDESRVIDRATHHPLFRNELLWPNVETIPQ